MATSNSPYLQIILLLVTTINVLIVLVGASSTTFKVGETGIWGLPESNNTDFYNLWATHKRFTVGDSIYFEYKKEDSVLVVDKNGYYHCNITAPISSFNGGNTVFKLTNPGFIYFISGVPENCKNGERMIINVMGIHHSTTPIYQSGSIPPESFSIEAPSPSPNANSGISFRVDNSIMAIALVGSLFWVIAKD